MAKEATILVTDDNIINLTILSEALTLSGYNVKTARNGQEALDRLENDAFDLILLDLILPDINGDKILAHIKNTQHLRHIPVIMISGMKEIDKIAECIQLGAADYLTKPFQPVLLKARLQASLTNKRLYDSELASRKALKESETRYRNLFDNASDLIQGINQDGQFIYVNRQWCHVLEYTEKEARQLHFENILHPNQLTYCRQIFQELQQGQSIQKLETIFLTKSGKEIIVEGTVNPHFENEQFVMTQGIFRDVTARKQAALAMKKALIRTHTLYQVAQSLIAYKNIPNLLTFLTQKIAVAMPADRILLTVLDMEKQEILYFSGGGPGWKIVDKYYTFEKLMDSLVGWALTYKTTATAQADEVDTRVSNNALQERKRLDIGSTIVVPIYRKRNPIGTLVAVNRHDQPYFDRDDVELLEALSHLVAVAIENVELYEAEQLSQQMLQQQNQELDAFAGTVAHDLKSPLNAISGFAQLLEFEDAPVIKHKQWLKNLTQTVERMQEIVNELLLLARVRKEEIELELIDMDTIMMNMQKRLGFIIETSEAVITYPNQWELAWGYSAWVEEVWVNYIHNAIKYGGKPPIITIGSNLQEDQTVRFWVQDNGEGIKPEYQNKLFIPFSRLSERKVEGQGLGLSIVERIITKLNGQVGFTSEAEKGSIFWFTLPAYTS